MGKYILIDNTVSGKEGSVFIDIFNEVTELIGVQSVEVTDNIKDRTLNTVGTKRSQTKASTIDGSGKMSLQYHNVSMFSKIIANYRKTGKWEKFNLTVINDGETSGIGKRTIKVTGCSLTGDVPIAKLSGENDDSLIVDISFKYDDWDTIGDFNKLTTFGVE